MTWLTTPRNKERTGNPYFSSSRSCSLSLPFLFPFLLFHIYLYNVSNNSSGMLPCVKLLTSTSYKSSVLKTSQKIWSLILNFWNYSSAVELLTEMKIENCTIGTLFFFFQTLGPQIGMIWLSFHTGLTNLCPPVLVPAEEQNSMRVTRAEVYLLLDYWQQQTPALSWSLHSLVASFTNLGTLPS